MEQFSLIVGLRCCALELRNGPREWAFAQAKDIVPNARVQDVGASVMVQKKMKHLNVELIVRGCEWGSMAAAYEKGKRTFCGLSAAGDLNRLQKFETPQRTRTTKAEVGHDENMTMAEVEALVGNDIAQQAKDIAMKLCASEARR